MTSASKAVLALIVLVVIAAAGIWYWNSSHPPTLPTLLPPPAQPAPPQAAAPAGPLHPIEAPAEQPLPALDQSDGVVGAALAGLDRDAVARFLNLEGFIRRVVATIDNLPRESYAARLNPVKPTAGLPVTRGEGSSLVLAPENAARYTPFVKAMQAVDTRRIVEVYRHFYPLFQQAYVELGYPNGYFNDRLVEVIDHLLDAPEVAGPIRLKVPHVLYEYADPDLQSLSSGRKVLVRMGVDNERRVKAKLREIRAAVTAQPPQVPKPAAGESAPAPEPKRP
jgi:hypothetical protein